MQMREIIQEDHDTVGVYPEPCMEPIDLLPKIDFILRIFNFDSRDLVKLKQVTFIHPACIGSQPL